LFIYQSRQNPTLSEKNIKQENPGENISVFFDEAEINQMCCRLALMSLITPGWNLRQTFLRLILKIILEQL